MQVKINTLSENIFNAIEHFLGHFLDYATDIVLSINAETLDVKIDSPAKIPANFQQYSIADYILTDENGLYKPDGNAIDTLSKKILA